MGSKKNRESGNIISRKATPDEVQAYKQMLLTVAIQTAEASKEGGFLDFGGVLVSSAEQSFLNAVQHALQLADP